MAKGGSLALKRRFLPRATACGRATGKTTTRDPSLVRSAQDVDIQHPMFHRRLQFAGVDHTARVWQLYQDSLPASASLAHRVVRVRREIIVAPPGNPRAHGFLPLGAERRRIQSAPPSSL